MRVLVVFLASAALLSGCGADGGSDGRSTVPDAAPGTVGGSAEVTGTDDGSGGVILKTLARQLTGSLTGGASYEIEDGALRIVMSGPFDESSSYGQCQIATTARDGVGERGAITLAYTDRDLDCDTVTE